MTRFARGEGSKGSNRKEFEEATSWKTMKADMESAKKKKKKLKKKLIDTEVQLDHQADKSENKKRTLTLDSELSDSPVMKKSKSSFNAIDTDVPESIVNEQEEKETTINKKKKKSKSLEELKKDWVIENGIKYKIFKNGIKKPWFDLAYEENDIMTRYNNFFVKREVVKELDDYKKSLEEQGLSRREVTKKLLHKEEKFHNKLRVELLRNEIKEKISSDDKINQKVKKPKRLQDESDNSKQTLISENKKVKKTKELSDISDNSEHTLNPDQNALYEENEMMTQFEGYWILRENLAHLQQVADIKLNRIIQQRADGNTDQKLTPDEEILYRRLMKKEKRREQTLLKTRLPKKNIQIPRDNSKFRGENSQDWKGPRTNNQLVKFDGYFIRKDGAERLNKLRETMITKGCTKEEIENITKNERRKEERILKRENNLFCFKCRSSGHMVSTCPESMKDGQNNAYDVCFRCGSAEHMARHCKVKSKGGSYPLATCFICNEVGHISRECPDNPKGLYPNGGCCNECGSVEHLKRDCPDLQKKNEENTITLSRFRRGEEIERIEEESGTSEPRYSGTSQPRYSGTSEPRYSGTSQPSYENKQRPKTIIFDD